MFKPSVIALAAFCAAVPVRSAAQSATAATGTAASPSPVAPPPPPVQPASAAPAYRSAWRDYRPYADQAVGNWREANDTAGRIGGWKAYAREAQGRGAPPPGGGTAWPSAPVAAPFSPRTP